GETAHSIRLDLPPFTLVGATTRAGYLSPPLRDRFGVINRLEFYTEEELKQIIVRASAVLHVDIADEAAGEMAKRSRGTPRVANRLLRRVRDFAPVEGEGTITASITAGALERLQVDRLGLDDIDHTLLMCLIEKFHGGPVGLDTSAASIGEEP